MSNLFEELDRLAAQPDPEACSRLVDRICEVAPTLDPDALRALDEHLRQVVDRLVEEREQARSALATVSDGRRALRGYGHLRSHHVAQRVTRRV